MAWDDVNNLWWLKRQDTSENLLPAIGLGVQMRQQQQETALRLKQQALQEQTRLDMLQWRNRQVDQEIAEYEDKRDYALKKQQDMDRLNKIMPNIMSGEPITGQFETTEGQQAFTSATRAAAYIQAQKRESAAQLKARTEFKQKMAALWEDAPMVASRISNQIPDDEDEMNEQTLAEVNAAYNTISLPKRMRAPAGMQTGSVRVPLPGGGFTTFETPPAPFVKGKTKEDFIREYITKVRGTEKGSFDPIEKITQEAERVWNSGAGASAPSGTVQKWGRDPKTGKPVKLQ